MDGSRSLGWRAGSIVFAWVALAVGGVAPHAGAEDEAPARERALPVGTASPPLEVAGWVNAPEGQEPTVESLAGKPLFLEFWGISCGPCVRSMPKVQQIHQRYGPHGLVVLGIAGDAASAQASFAKEHGLGFPLAIDAGGALKDAFRIDGIPTSVLVDKEGKVAAVTWPGAADDEIDKLLGLKPGAGGALCDFLAAKSKPDTAAARFHLERMLARHDPLDLKAWATELGGKAPEGGAAVPEVKGEKALLDLVKAGSDAVKRQAVLDALALAGPTAFDLPGWARPIYAKEHPASAAELKAMLAAKRYDPLVDTIVDRRPPSAALEAIVKDEGLQAFAAQHARTERKRARRALMVMEWVLGKRGLKDQTTSERFSREMSSNGWLEDKDKRVQGMDIDGTMITRSMGNAWIEQRFARGLVMESLAAGKRPDLAKLQAEIAKRRAAELKDLEATYGG